MQNAECSILNILHFHYHPAVDAFVFHYHIIKLSNCQIKIKAPRF